MIKIWRGDENTDDKIIALSSTAIHKGNPGNTEINNCITDLQKDIIPQKGFTTIPVSYIKEIQLQENKKYIAVLFGQDSEEHFKLNDEILRNEVFCSLKQNLANTHLETPFNKRSNQIDAPFQL